jgi:hypothetical protein
MFFSTMPPCDHVLGASSNLPADTTAKTFEPWVVSQLEMSAYDPKRTFGCVCGCERLRRRDDQTVSRFGGPQREIGQCHSCDDQQLNEAMANNDKFYQDKERNTLES